MNSNQCINKMSIESQHNSHYSIWTNVAYVSILTLMPSMWKRKILIFISNFWYICKHASGNEDPYYSKLMQSGDSANTIYFIKYSLPSIYGFTGKLLVKGAYLWCM